MDYGEILCQAMDLIAGKNTEQIKFDKTKVCTIIDDSLKQQGRYTVEEGSVSYTAFSNSTTYQKDDVVYVQIPEGNYDEQKLIIGKKLKANELSYNYISPFENFISLDETKIKIDENVNGLIANGEIQKQEIYSEDFSSDPKTAYNRLGISADFTTLLGQDLSSGNYGLIVQLSNEKEVIENFVLDCQDMNGFIYSFLEPTRQEFLFDISAIITKITKIQVYFYQMGNFKNKQKKDISVKDTAFNLFVQNLEISFGIELNDSKKENLILFTKDSLTYGDNDKDKRKIELRWVRLKDDKSRIFLPKDLGKNEIDEQYEIRWYKYKAGEEGDSVSGQNWEKLKNKEEFSYSFTPDVVNNAEEKFKVVLIQYAKDKTINSFYISNFITFVNKEEIVNKSTLDSVYGLSLKPEDGSQGSYFLYDFSHNLINMSNATQVRKLQCYYKEKSDNVENTKLFSAEDLRWIIPMQNSMLKFDDYLYYPYYSSKEVKEKNFLEKNKIENGQIYGVINSSNNLVDKYYENKNGTSSEVFKNELTILINAKNSNEKQLEVIPISEEFTYLPYYIKSQYYEQYTNNIISCYYKEGRKTYQDKFSFSFGLASINGADSNLILKLIDGDYSVNGEKYKCISYINGDSLDTEINYIGIEAQIFDSQGKEITNYDNITFNFSLYNPYNIDSKTNLILFEQNSENNKIVFKIKTGSNFSRSAIDIIVCQVKGLKNYNLNTYLGIPIKYSDKTNYKEIVGPDCVMIDTGGQAAHEKINYTLINDKGQAVYPSGLKWRMISEDKKINDKAEFEKFYPTIEEPKNFYETIVVNSNITLDSESNYRIHYRDVQPIYSIEYETDNTTIMPITNLITDEENNPQYTTYDGTIFLSGANDKEIKKYINRHENSDDNFTITLMERELKPSELEWSLKVYDLILDNCPKLAIQAYAQGTEIQDEKIYFQKPLIILHNTWISKIINEWDGKTLGINEKEGYLLGKMLAAGSKNDDNEFSGVILGDWKNTETQEILTKNTGLYGFHDGIMSFYFKDDGTAAIGKKGIGQIQFNGNQGIIQSGIYELSGGKDGALINFSTGKIELRNSKNGNIELNASETTIYETEVLDEEKGLVGIVNAKDKNKNTHLIYQDNKWQVIKYEKDEITNKYTGNYTIQEGEIGFPNYKSGFPIKAGENFKVAWDGSVFANNGRFTGTIHATGGTISGDMVVNGKLQGAIIESGKFQAIVELEGYWGEYYETVLRDEELDDYNALSYIDDDPKKKTDGKYKYWKIENNIYTKVNDNNELKRLQEQGLLEKRIIYWVPSDDDSKKNYFPIQFLASASTTDNSNLTEPIVNIGMLRTLQDGKTNMFGIQTIIGDGNLTTDLGFDSGNNMRFHAKGYVGMSRAGKDFNNPDQQVYLDEDEKNITYFVAKGMDRISLEGKKEIKLKADNIILEQGKNSIDLINFLKNVPTEQDIARMIAEALTGLGTGGEKGGS